MTSSVPSLHFDGADFPEAERFDRWRALMPPYDVARLDAASEPFLIKTDAWLLGELVVTSGVVGPVRFVRPREKIRLDGVDNLSFLLLRSGFWTGDIDGKMLTAGPGELVMFDLARPYSAEGAGSDHVTVQLPRKAIENEVAVLPDVHGLVLTHAPGRMLADHFLSMVRHLPDMRMTDVAAVTRATINLIVGAVTILTEGRETPESANGAALRHRVRRHIDQNLTNPALGPEGICRELAISRSALYRAFEPLGGVAYYIQGRRLEAVHALLSRADGHRRIADIAYAHGFTNDAHFSTAFRRRYGYTPSDARRGATGTVDLPDASGEAAAFLDWVRKLNT
jgi:AraC-like DNA-binding protein